MYATGVRGMLTLECEQQLAVPVDVIESRPLYL